MAECCFKVGSFGIARESKLSFRFHMALQLFKPSVSVATLYPSSHFEGGCLAIFKILLRYPLRKMIILRASLMPICSCKVKLFTAYRLFLKQNILTFLVFFELLIMQYLLILVFIIPF